MDHGRTAVQRGVSVYVCVLCTLGAGVVRDVVRFGFKSNRSDSFALIYRDKNCKNIRSYFGLKSS
jgi:hypothetical protein